MEKKNHSVFPILLEVAISKGISNHFSTPIQGHRGDLHYKEWDYHTTMLKLDIAC